MRIGILSDAHGNVEAFRAGLEVLDDAQVDQVYFLGDAVGYIPDPGVVSLLRESGILAIRGNHDDMLIRRSTPVEKDDIYRHGEVFAVLDDEERRYLSALPLRLELGEGGFTTLFVHGSPLNPLMDYVYPDSDLSVFHDIDADVVFMGHTHHPFIREHGGKLFVNVGSCGLPRGNDLRGAVCTFDTAGRTANLVRFDISGCCERVLSRYSLSPSVTSLLNRCVQRTGSSRLEER
jgi:putative phosphoesterase